MKQYLPGISSWVRPHNICGLLALVLTTALYSSPPARAAAESPLFTSHDVLDLTLSVNFDALCRPREVEDCQYSPTTLIYTEPGGVEHHIPVEIRIRGGWRAIRKNCVVPPLFMRFPAEGTEGTPFAGQAMLPLTTHCRIQKSVEYDRVPGKEYEQYVLKEYLGYRLYNILTDTSLRVRLVHINYINPAKKNKSHVRYAFFTEHFDSLAQRQQVQRLSRKSFDHEKVDLDAFDRVALFNYMIGNTDWSVVRGRNILLIGSEEGPQIPVPFDLDMSGLVDAEYAGTSPNLDFRDVRQRLYLGFCHPEVDFIALYVLAVQNKPRIMALPGQVAGMSKLNRNRSLDYLASFFETVQSEPKRQKSIAGACRPWPPEEEDHTTPPDRK